MTHESVILKIAHKNKYSGGDYWNHKIENIWSNIENFLIVNLVSDRHASWVFLISRILYTNILHLLQKSIFHSKISYDALITYTHFNNKFYLAII